MTAQPPQPVRVYIAVANVKDKSTQTGEPIQAVFVAVFVSALLITLIPSAAQASGVPAMPQIGATFIALGVGLVNFLFFTVLFAFRRRTLIRSLSRLVTLLLLFVLSELMVFSLVELVWMWLHPSRYPITVGLVVGLAHPLLFLSASRQFRADLPKRSVWRGNALLAALTLLIIGGIILGEAVL